MPLWPSFAQVIDFAESSVRLSASAEAMSGRGAPFLTPMPTPERAMEARESASTLPCLARSSIPELVRIATSNASPASIWRLSAAARPNEITSLFPVSRSKAGASSSSAALTPFDARTLISAALTEAAASKAAIAASDFAFMSSPLLGNDLRLGRIGDLDDQILDRLGRAGVARDGVECSGRLVEHSARPEFLQRAVADLHFVGAFEH